MTLPPEVTRALAFDPVCSTSSDTPPSPMWILSPTLKLGQHVQSLDDDALGRRSLDRSLRTSSISSPTVSVDRRRAEGAGADLGAGDVDHDREVGHEGAQSAKSGDARGDVAVGEGESKDVDARHGQGLQDSSLSEAGPMVATIRVRRTWFPSLLLTSLSDDEK